VNAVATDDVFTLQIVQSSTNATARETMRTPKASAHGVGFAEGEDSTCAVIEQAA
jgi:hypothetical protein